MSMTRKMYEINERIKKSLEITPMRNNGGDMSEPTKAENEATKARMRTALDILENYYDPKTGKIDATKLTQDAKKGAEIEKPSEEGLGA